VKQTEAHIMLHPEACEPPKPGFFPRRITLELTNRCNLNCTFCPRKLMEKNYGDISVSMAFHLIDQMSEHLPVTLVPFFRGEPLLHHSWRTIIRYAKKRGIGPIQMTTNGNLLDENAAMSMIELGVDFLSFSVDTVDPALYEKHRRGGHYESVVQNIQRLVSLRRKLNGSQPTIQVSAVATDSYRSGIDNFIRFWQPFVDRVRIYYEHSKDNNPGSIVEPLPLFTHRLPCWKPFTDMVIYWDGGVALCNHDWTRKKDQLLGRADEEPLAEIWQKGLYLEIRDAHLKGNVNHISPCDGCDHWKMYYLKEGYLGRVYENTPD